MTYSCSLGSVHSPSLHILPLSLPLHKRRGGGRAGKQGSPGPVPLRMDTVQRQKAAGRRGVQATATAAIKTTREREIEKTPSQSE